MQLGLGDRAKRVIMIVTIAIGVACLGWRAKWAWDAYHSYLDEIAACEAAIVKTQTDIQAQRQELTDVNQEKQEVLANYHKLGDAGITVAQLQNEWSTYVYRLSICQDGEKEMYRQEIYDTVTKMKDYFSEVPFGWFAWTDRNVEWTCATNYSFYTNTLRTVWICQAAGVKTASQRMANAVYAYATADYSYDTRKFSNVDIRITDEGRKIRVDQDVIAEYGVTYELSEFPIVDSECKLYYPIGTGVFETHVKSAEEDPSRRPAGMDGMESDGQSGSDQGGGEEPAVGTDAETETGQEAPVESDPGDAAEPDVSEDPGTGSDETDTGMESSGGTLFD